MNVAHNCEPKRVIFALHKNAIAMNRTKSLRTISTLLCLALLPATMQAQAWKKLLKGVDKAVQTGIERGLTKAVENKAEEVAGRIIERELNRHIDKLLPAEQQAMSLEERMMKAIGIEPVPHAKTYTYTSSMRIAVERIEPGQQPVTTHYRALFSDASMDYAIDFDDPNRERTGRLIIYDAQNQALVVLSEQDGQKQGMVIGLAQSDTLVADITALADYAATGRTKTVAGQECAEYVADNASIRSEIWVASNLRCNYSKAYTYCGGMQLLARAMPSTAGLGAVLEQHLLDKTSNTTLNFEVKELNAEQATDIDISDYKVIGVNTTRFHAAAEQ